MQGHAAPPSISSTRYATAGRILLQKAVDVLPGDTPETLQRRVMEQAEWKLLPEAQSRLRMNLRMEEAYATLRKGGSTMELIDLRTSGTSLPGPRHRRWARAPDGGKMPSSPTSSWAAARTAETACSTPCPSAAASAPMAADPAKLEDPSLIIYNPVLTLGKTHIVTNGDQTDTIYDGMSRGKSFADSPAHPHL